MLAPPGSARYRAARWISILGHPFILITVAVGFAAAQMLPKKDTLVIVTALVAAFSVLGAFVVRGMLRGNITNVDVSVREQRPPMYRLAIALTAMVLLTVVLTEQPPRVVRGTAAALGMMVAGFIINTKLKISLHAAMSVYAAAILWTAGFGYGAVFLAISLVVAWSRIVMGRHTPVEVFWGLLLGAVAGGVIHIV